MSDLPIEINERTVNRTNGDLLPGFRPVYASIIQLKMQDATRRTRRLLEEVLITVLGGHPSSRKPGAGRTRSGRRLVETRRQHGGRTKPAPLNGRKEAKGLNHTQRG